VVDARAAPPEFAADALLRLAGSERVVDPDWQRELLEEAYLAAYSAPLSYRRVALTAPPDSRQGAEAIASDTALTRVSLQVRASQMMASIDASRAREMFGWIDLDLESGTCDSPLVPAVDEYYSTLSILARTTFPGDIDGRGDALRFLTLYLFRAHLPTDLPAVTRAVRRFRATREEEAYLDTVVRWIFEGSLRDPRGFSSSAVDLVAKVMELEDADRGLGLLGWSVTRILRDYLLGQFAGPRCSDTVSDGQALDAFNAELRRREVRPETIAPLSAGDWHPSATQGGVRLDRFWQTLEAQRLYQAMARLRGNARNPVAERARRTEAWMTAAERLLDDVEHWSGTREAFERDYLYQKAAVYTLMVDLVPASALRIRTIRSFVNFLRQVDRDRNARALWFAFAKRVIELVRSADRPYVLDALESSGHPTLVLYGRLERTLEADRR